MTGWSSIINPVLNPIIANVVGGNTNLPSNLAVGLAIHLDASLESTGTAVETITDRSTNGYTVDQSVIANRPNITADSIISGKNAFDFTAGTDFWEADNAAGLVNGEDTPCTIHIVLKSDQTAATQVVFGFGDSSTTAELFWFGLSSTGVFRFARKSTSSSQINIDFGTTDTNVHIVSLNFKGTELDVWLDGQKVVDGTAMDVGSLSFDKHSIGCLYRTSDTNHFDGFIGEIREYNISQSDSVIGEVHRYLINKWTTWPTTFDVSLSSGQSNREGRGAGSSSTITGNKCFIYNAGDFDAVTGDPVGGASSGSLDPTFINEWFSLTGRGIILVEEAKGGAALHPDADSGAGNWDKAGGSLFNTAVSNFNAAVSALSSNTVFRINKKFVTWHQGERDAQEPIAEADYETKFGELIDNFVADAGIDYFFAIELGALDSDPDLTDSDWEGIRSAQRDVIASKSVAYNVYPLCKLFEKESRLNVDGIHYNQTGLDHMGEWGAEIAHSIVNGAQKSSLYIDVYESWHFEETSGNRAGELTYTLIDSGTTGNRTGKSGNAVDFGGTTDLSITKATLGGNFWGAGNFTIGAWIQKDSATDETLFGCEGAAANIGWSLQAGSDFTIRASANGTTVLSTASLGSVSGWTCALLEWSEYDEEFTLYVNGSSVGTLAVSGGLFDSTADFVVGGRDSGSNRMDGGIDELTLWNHLLTDEQKTEFYNSGTGKFYPFEN